MQGYALDKGSIRCHQVVGTTDITTTSTSFVDMADMSITFTLKQAKDVVILFTGVVFNSKHGYVYTTITVDGVNKCNQQYFGTGDAEGREQISGFWKESLAAGQHTVKMQWKTSTGTASCFGATAAPRVLQVLEMCAS